jgi:hypothetical protein
MATLASILGAGGRKWIVTNGSVTMAPGRAYLADGGTTSDDPNWAQVAALLSFDGNLSDATGNVWTPVNNFASSSAQSRFGGASGRWPANNAAMSTPSATKFNMSGDFCIDFWWRRPSTLTGGADVLGRGAGAGATQWIIYHATDTSLRFYANNADVVSTGPLAADTWHPIRFNRAGTSIASYASGTRIATNTDSRNYTNTNVLEFGRVGFSGSPADTHIDEFRLTVGASRETGASYTPSTTAFPRLGATMLHSLPAAFEAGDEFLVYCVASAGPHRGGRRHRDAAHDALRLPVAAYDGRRHRARIGPAGQPGAAGRNAAVQQRAGRGCHAARNAGPSRPVGDDASRGCPGADHRRR